ncbi:unnamed protein product [Dracunculus medinensis]|uniref:HORMA domain-containing protein n=1 Tax=Dracunculus medinensis TaxID=318479 RepID=A0A158Q5S0_DRAME|nr:unnamed protein product [Dracunculus medinensis]
MLISSVISAFITRSYKELCEFDCQLHCCVFDRDRSRLKELTESDCVRNNLRVQIEEYLTRLSQITGRRLINCFLVLKFLELDSRGNQYLLAEETSINTPAIACAIVTKDFEAQSCEQLSLRVCSIIYRKSDMGGSNYLSF